ncbi:MAG: hypothetical protein ACE5R6_00265 [Candidatus Heimdallarchaeota archaeon]
MWTPEIRIPAPSPPHPTDQEPLKSDPLHGTPILLSYDSFSPYEQAYQLPKKDVNSCMLPSQVTQQTMKVIRRPIRSFYGLLQERKKGDYKRPI